MDICKNKFSTLSICFLGILMFISGNSFAQKTETYGNVVFENLVFNLGEVKKLPLMLEVHYTNTGPGELKIYQVTTPCICVNASFSKKPLKKNGKGKISVIIEPEKMTKGDFTKILTILHDGSEKGVDQIIITGTVL